ncbi:MAG: M48 family metallopeptidase [Cyanobacteriota bacterium]|nr:M48 family metallopeptidase [Cyanobacteriota bacterium]
MPTYKEISSEAFRHPLDRQAEKTLRALPGFDFIARKFVEFAHERSQLVYLMANTIEVGPRQYSTIYQIFRECVRDLDIYPEPKLFVEQNPIANSYGLGREHPYIVINTGILDLLNEAEIRFVLAHELGHIKCGHTILIQMAMWAMNAASIVGDLTFGIGNIVSSGLIFAFFEWRRKAELTADRAALLVTDDLTTVMSSMMKISAGSIKYANECSLQEFILQSENYQALDKEGLNQIYEFLTYNGAQGAILSHLFAVERVHFLREWAVSQEYGEIKKGNYRKESNRGAVEVKPENSKNKEVDELRRQIEELQQEINQVKGE